MKLQMPEFTDAHKGYAYIGYRANVFVFIHKKGLIVTDFIILRNLT